MSDWALSALKVCAEIVDISWFSTSGATLVASAPEDERARVVGPVTFVALLLPLRGS
jgi:hypothetical protein